MSASREVAALPGLVVRRSELAAAEMIADGGLYGVRLHLRSGARIESYVGADADQVLGWLADLATWWTVGGPTQEGPPRGGPSG